MKLEDLSSEEREQLKREALTEALAATPEPLTIAQIRTMRPDQLRPRLDEAEAVIAAWYANGCPEDGAPAEGEVGEQKKLTPLEQYRANGAIVAVTEHPSEPGVYSVRCASGAVLTAGER